MGKGFTMKCEKCNKEYNFLIGEGMLSLSLNFVNVLAFCEKCGYWEMNKEPFFSISTFQHIKNINEDLKFSDYLDEKECKKCNIKMKKKYKYRYIEADESPKLACPVCNKIMNFKGPLLWD